MPEHLPASLASRLEAAGRIDLRAAFTARGIVLEAGDGVAQVGGLGRVGYQELVAFDSGAIGMAYDLEPARTGVVLLFGAAHVRTGEGAVPTGALPRLPAGPQLLGRVVDPLGRPLDGRPPPAGESRALFAPAPELLDRASVTRPLFTGILAVDAAIPIGRGQRQLVVGDRNVGKTALALDIVAAQRSTGVRCVYVAVGQPLSRVLGIADALAESGAFLHTAVVAAEAADAPGMQYLAPFAGTALAEVFRDDGKDALVVFDDLTKHADAYRELSLLLERPPGREAFPGDIFYLHAELLERATALAERRGGGTLTAIPIVETSDGDLSAYIPTNLISITDGQIYLDVGRFERNERPAIDVGRSVSRIGGAAQPRIVRAAAKNLRIDLSRYEVLETLTRVGLDVDPKTRVVLARGRALRELLRQPRFSPRSVADQVLALVAVDGGLFDDVAPESARRVLERVAARARSEAPDLVEALGGAADAPDDRARARVAELVRLTREAGS